MKRMLINATQAEELRVAIADGQKLIDLDLETPAHEQKKANVYKARITRVEHSLEACFVNYGSERHGFLPFKEINPTALPLPDKTNPNNVNLKDVLREGQELIVQVEKEERGTKGAALSTYISLAGRYSVLMPNSPKSGGVSRRISGEERDQIRNIMDQLNIPKGTGLIIRTAGVGRNIEELQWDLDYLQQLWAAIEKAAQESKAPFLIYQESNLIIRALRDYLRDDISEILIDSDSVYQSALEFMQLVMPYNLRKLKHYKSETPLFTRYQIESQIETAFAREVTLPSGGSLVIDHTEAMLSIDINSARATKGSDIEETALQTNLEAADEIARQLRIRDLGGLIVIDFIDMLNRGNQRRVEERLREALSHDRARIQVGRISKFGLLEMSRQRMRPSIGESSYQTCPRCDGHGSVRSVESLALSILRLIEEEAIKDYTGQILAQAPTKVANFLHNEKREAVRTIEHRHNVPILVLANPDMHTPRFEIKRLRKAEISSDPSYMQVNLEEGELVASAASKSTAIAEKPAVSGVHPSAPAPHKRSANQGWWRAITAFFAGRDSDEDSGPRRGKRKPKPAAGKAAKPAGKKRKSVKQDSGKQTAKGRPQRKKTAKKAGKKTTGKQGAKKAAAKDNKQNQPNANQPSTEGAKSTPRRRGKRGGRKRRARQQQKEAQTNANQAGNNSQGNQQNSGQQNQQAQQTDNTTRQQNAPQSGGQKPAQAQKPGPDKSAQAAQAGSVEQAASKAPAAKTDRNEAADKPAQSTGNAGQQPQAQNQPQKQTEAKPQDKPDRVKSDQAPAAPQQPQSGQQASTQTPSQPARSEPQQPAARDTSSGEQTAARPAQKAADSTRDTGASSDNHQAAQPTQSQPAAAPQKPSAADSAANQASNRPDADSQPSDSKQATQQTKPAPEAAPQPTGPSAKPESVKGIYSLSDSGDKASGEKTSGDKSGGKPANTGNSSERNGTDG